MENKKKKRKKKSPETLQHLKSYTKEELENIQVPKLEQSVSNSYKVLVRDEVCSLRCSVIQLHGSVKCLNQRWGNKANQ